MGPLLKRIVLVAGGAFLLVANNGMGGEGTFLDFYPPVSAEAIGYDMSKLAIAALALWTISRGIRPKTNRNPVSSSSPIPESDLKGAPVAMISGFQRLGLFVTVLWLGFWLVAYLLDGPPFNWSAFVLFGVVPIAVVFGVPWGIWWVVVGFRSDRKG